MKELINLKKYNLKTIILTILLFACEFFVSIIMSVSILKAVLYKNYLHINSNKYIILSVISAIILIAFIIYNFVIKERKIEKIFTAIVIPLGMLYLFSVVPYQVPDEDAHIKRAWDISKGNIISEISDNGDSDIIVPKFLIENKIDKYKDLDKYLNENTDYTDGVETFTGAQAYMATMYLPSSIVFFIARKIGINLLIAVYLARIANFIIFIIFAYFSIKIIPFGKLVMFVYLLTPMFLEQAASVSADSLTNTFLMFFIAYSLYLFKTDVKLSKKHICLYALLCIFIGTAKYTYFPLIGIALLLLKKKDVEPKEKWLLTIISIVGVTFIAIAVYLLSTKYVNTSQILIDGNVNPKEQMKWILNNPIKYIGYFFDTILNQIEFYINSFLGYKLGFLNIQIKQFAIWVLAILMIFAPFLEKNEVELNKWEKLLFIGIFCIIFILIHVGLYLTWSPVGADMISGVPGRYYIPIVILLLLSMVKSNKYLDVKNVYLKYSILLILINISAVGSIVRFFI